MARRVRQLSSKLAGAPALTGKSLLLSVIIEHRATPPAQHLEATREERYAHLRLNADSQHERIHFSLTS